MGALTPEGKVKRMVKAVLDKYHVWHFMPASNGFGRAGIPDIIAIVDGGFVGIEVKADKTKKPTALQVRCGKEIQAAGGRWFLVFDEDSCAELERFIQEKVT
jgi:hypothetical protein